MLGSGDAYVTEPAFLLEFLAIAERAHVREDPVLHPGHENNRVLETLRVVERHEGDDLRVLERVDICDQTHRLEEQSEFADAVEVRPIRRAERSRTLLLEIGNGGHEFLEVLFPTHGLDGALRPDHVEVAGFTENRFDRSPRTVVHPFLKVVDEPNELTDAALGPRREPGVLVGSPQRVQEPDPLRLGEAVDVCDAGISDRALRDVDDAFQGNLIGRIDEHPQIGERVLHLAPVVVLEPTDHLVGDAVPDEQLFDDAALGIGPVEHRDVGQRDPALFETPDLLRDEGSLFVLVLRLEGHDRLPTAIVRPQPLRLPRLVVRDHGIRRVEDRLGGSIVSFEEHHLGVRIVLLEVEDVAHVGPAKRVDRLIGIADDEQVPMLPGEQFDEHVLGAVRVLVLIDEDVSEPLLIGLEDLRERLEDLDGQHEDIVEIDRRRFHEALLIEAIDVRDLLVVVTGVARSVTLVVDEFVLRVGDRDAQRPRREPFRVQVQVLHHHRDEAHGIGVVVDGERGSVSEARGFASQDTNAGTVKCGDPHPVCDPTDEVGNTIPHLSGSLVGERDGEERVRRQAEIADQVGDAVGEHPRLAGSGTRDHEHRAVGGGNGFALRCVQGLEKSGIRHRTPKCTGRPDRNYRRVTKLGRSAMRTQGSQ